MNLKRGFTLIELLIVMAILGVLAVVVLVAINPVQQLARTRDAGRKSTVAQMGHALEAYYTTQNANYPDASGWATFLVTAGELSVVPSIISNSLSALCSGSLDNGWCYDTDSNTMAVIYSALESDSEINKCTGTSTDAWFVWSTQDGRAGLVCDNTEPTAGSQVFTD